MKFTPEQYDLLDAGLYDPDGAQAPHAVYAATLRLLHGEKPTGIYCDRAPADGEQGTRWQVVAVTATRVVTVTAIRQGEAYWDFNSETEPTGMEAIARPLAQLVAVTLPIVHELSGGGYNSAGHFNFAYGLTLADGTTFTVPSHGTPPRDHLAREALEAFGSALVAASQAAFSVRN